MSNTLKFGAGKWAAKAGSVLAYNDLNNNFKPLPFTFTRASSATRVNESGLIESVGSGIPRVDYLNNADGHLLLEPSRTNIALYSEDFSNAAWIKFSGGAGLAPVVTANAGIAPDGTMTADQIVFSADGTTSSDQSLIRQSITTSAVDYADSIYLKTLSGTATLLLRGAAGSSFTVLTITDTWQRFSTVELGIAGTGTRFEFGLRQALSGIGLINTTATILAWGAQLEAGSYATSYIPTSGSSVTRVADTSVQIPPSGIIGQTEGTLFAEVNLSQLQGSVARTFIDIGSVSNRVFVGFTSLQSNTIRLQIDTSVLGSAVDIRATVSSVGKIKVAAAYKNGDCALYVNGVAGTIVANGAISFTTISNLFLGQTISGTASLSGGISQALLYNTRLSNAELAALTSL